MNKRCGFGILEAIVTIVLLSLIFATIPMLLSKATESDIASLEGEALYHASALISRIAALPFNSALLDGNESRILNLNCDETLNGHAVYGGTRVLAPSKFRSCVKDAAALEALGDTSPQLAINHFHGYDEELPDRGFDLNVTAQYLHESDNWDNWPGAIESNLVLITVTASHSATGEVIGTLRYVAANIGSPDSAVRE